MGREMWNYAKLGALGVSANKCADLDGVLINGSHSGWIVEFHCADNRYFTRTHSKVRGDRSCVRGDLPSLSIAAMAEHCSARSSVSLHIEMELERFAPSAIREVTP